MTDPQQPPLNLGLDFVADDSRSGFRLQRLEVLNWGTFDGRVWGLELDGRNALLTGDIGSGKSTLVDALTTLLVPAQRIAYNKAAGAGSRERTLRSYVLGHYKSERSAISGSARPVGLRDHNTLSVILGVFHNAGYDQTVSLAQVFWIKDPQAQPARFFVGAERALRIAEDFTDFGSDLTRLRRRLRDSGAHLEDSYPGYAAWFRRRLGIDNPQALELFHQTVSMKSVGNLTDFVRTHMLEPFAVEARIQALIGHFDDLDVAHQAVLKARHQVELLRPMVADLDRHDTLLAQTDALVGCREALCGYFARLKLELLERRLAKHQREHDEAAQGVEQLETESTSARLAIDELKQAIHDNGGDRLERLALEIQRQGRLRDERQRRAERYGALSAHLDEPAASDAAAFSAQRQRLAGLGEALRARAAELQDAHTEQAFALRQGRQQHEALCAEIDSLRRRRSNIDDRQVRIREALCTALDLNPEAMPFAGELIRVREEARDWEGAAERLLHSFALSLLVPDAHYAAVADWVERNQLRGRLVYYHVRTPHRDTPPRLHPDSLLRKLEIKPEAPCLGWLEQALAQRFDVACCDTQAQFRREPRALTRAGQVKGPSGRHEKDDRHRLDDRSRYVLGWSNAAKLATLERQRDQLEGELQRIGAAIATLQAEQAGLTGRLETLARLEEFSRYDELDWHSPTAEIARLREEQTRLASASDTLAQLNAQLEQAEQAQRQREQALVATRDALSGARYRLQGIEAQRQQTQTLLAEQPLEPARLKQLETLRQELLGEHRLTLESCDNRERDLRERLQARIDAQKKQLDRLTEGLIKRMSGFRERYPLETAEIDASLAAASEYRRLLAQLERDDLPRFVARFKEQLNVNTINEIASFNAQLLREHDTITERIAQINASLTQIDYSPGRYIALESQPTPDAEIRDFRRALRACTEETLGEAGGQYSEARFLQVKAIIDRFRGRDGQTESDRRWTDKVTDVRNWSLFAASERWRSDDSEHEHYSDSGGKSGGQKEKLAYTILAASLAYQFGLEWGAVRSRSFRFVVIDEAFGRGSDESARYGLELFGQLNLQLLIVTPLQKIHIIEPFVSHVGFVDNLEGRASRLRNLSIAEYRDRKQPASATAATAPA
ncbi:ATP-binding protein [Marichromatium bheemlicum]|uniref:ATP-dependent exonuclease SbcCD, C subunit-like protein n=1 Tax=Marichromatium bheemlicum TaxID=365339 RepID=A0ABX1I3H2_9GAMM|nr:ATP-binding protein [Marichromatium bheemlicum]NKN32034.1 ATP-dependent exonuclease SbcCD, C subunit-like protein [Marichromatium bheemlicum]